MTFRPTSLHHECATCIRHRALVRALSGHSLARGAQQKLYYEHLRQQYSDRIIYWTARAESRDRSMPSVTIVTDGMDQSKFSLPRHEAIRSKEFASFVRPRLHISAAIAHGWCVVFLVTPPETHKDSNTSIELLSHTLTVLKRLGAHLPSLHINIQSDNTCRECKNSMLMRWMTSLVASQAVQSMSLGCLRSGHSHEDIDQHFGRLSQWLNRWKVLQTPDDTVACIRAFLDQAKFFEKDRYVVALNRTRDWRLGWIPYISSQCCQQFVFSSQSYLIVLLHGSLRFWLAGTHPFA